MRLTAETLLIAGIVALFLKDSLHLLRTDEAMLLRGLGGRWRAGFGTRSWRLAGREPYLANPFLPHEAGLRLAWRMDGPRAGLATATSTPASLPAVLPRLGLFAWAIWLELFVLLPAALLHRAGTLGPLESIGLLYATIALALATTWWLRAPLGLGGKVFWSLAFECVACPPYAANLVRRIAATRSVDEDFLAAAERSLDPARRAVVARECLARIDDRIEAAAVASPALPALRAMRERLLSDLEPDESA